MAYYPDKIALSVKSSRLLRLLLKENPGLNDIIQNSADENEAKQKIGTGHLKN
jgi:hypothetical protein